MAKRYRLEFLKVLIPVLISISIAGCQFVNRRVETSCQNLDGKQYRLDRDTNNCFEIGTPGPCGEMMIFYENPSTSSRNSKFGFCDCDQGFKSESPCKDSPIRKRVYVHRDKRCYTVFSQGPCKNGEWLILHNKTGSPTCVPNVCINYGISRPLADQFWFYEPKRQACFQSLTQAYCPVGLLLELVHDSQYPKCRKKQCYGSLSYGIRSALNCTRGSRFSYLTKSCARVYNNVFGIG